MVGSENLKSSRILTEKHFFNPRRQKCGALMLEANFYEILIEIYLELSTFEATQADLLQ